MTCIECGRNIFEEESSNQKKQSACDAENSKLHWFVAKSNETMIKYLLDNHCDVNCQDLAGCTPLMTAVENRQESIIQILLDGGADITMLNHKNRSALHMMCADHSFSPRIILRFLGELHKKISTSQEIAQCLIDAGCHLYQAAYLRDAKIIEYFVNQGFLFHSVNPLSGLTALHVAVALMDIDSVKLLLKYGDSKRTAINCLQTPSSSITDKSNTTCTLSYYVNAQDMDGITPLMMAVLKKHPTVIKDLLDAGADMLMVNRKNKSALYMFCKEHNFSPETRKLFFQELSKKFSTSEEMAQCLIDAGCHLYQATFLNDAQVIKYMLEHDILANSMHPRIKQTALHLAVSVDNVEMVKLLLKYGADFTAPDENGSIPVHYVYQFSLEHTCEKVELLQILLNLDISPTSCNSLGFFQIAPTLMRGNNEAIRAVLQSNINLTAIDQKGQNVLHFLAANRNPSVVEELKPYVDKFDINVVDELGMSPLHIAAKNSNADMAQFLLSNGATPNCAHEKHGYSPLHVAYVNFKPQFENEWDRCLELLLQYNSDPQFIVTEEGNEKITVFDAAVKSDALEKIKPVIAHLAVQAGLGVLITKTTIAKMNSYPSLKKYFTRCKKLINKKICGSLTIFKLLTEDRKRISGYSGNKKLMMKLARLRYKQNLKSTHWYYYNTLNKRISAGIQRRRSLDNAAGIISEIFNYRLNKSNLIINKIANYLNDDSLVLVTRDYQKITNM